MAIQPLPALAQYRAQHGLTQEALAEELGVAGVTVSRWETGVRKIAVKVWLEKVSAKTGIPKAELRPDLANLLSEAAE